MPGRLEQVRETVHRAALMAHAGLVALRPLLQPLVASIGLVLRRVLEIALALIVLFEEWGWRPLAELLGRLARLRPFAVAEAWIAALPPYGALLVFALPSGLLLPLKLLALWLIAHGKAFAAGALFVGAKLVGTALVARIFLLTRPALLRIGWFKRAYDWFVPWQEAIFAQVRASWTWRHARMLKTAIKHEARQAWARMKPGAQRLIARLRALYATNSSRR